MTRAAEPIPLARRLSSLALLGSLACGGPAPLADPAPEPAQHEPASAPSAQGIPNVAAAPAAPSRSSTIPPPADGPSVLMPDAVPDAARAACVATAIAGEASVHADSLLRAESRDHVRRLRDEARAQELRRMRAARLSEANRAMAAAARAPGNATLRRSAMASEAAANQSASAWLGMVHDQNAARRAAALVATSAGPARQFADLAATHEAAFELHAASGAGGGDALGGVQAVTLASLRSAAEDEPELEWLYVERFVLAYGDVDLCAAGAI